MGGWSLRNRTDPETPITRPVEGRQKGREIVRCGNHPRIFEGENQKVDKELEFINKNRLSDSVCKGFEIIELSPSEPKNGRRSKTPSQKRRKYKF